MAGKQARRFTVEEKLRILEEARAPNTTVAEVLRRHGLDATTFYRWERLAKPGMREALAERAWRGIVKSRVVDRDHDQAASFRSFFSS